MEMYNILVEPQASDAMMSVVKYIAGSLKSPQSASDTLHALKKGIKELDFMPHRYAVLPDDLLGKDGIRRKLVRNFYIYFWIDENLKTVNVIDVIYVGREQRDRLSKMDMD